QKMSKSYDNTLEIFGEEKPSRKKIMRIVTDSAGVEDAKEPETSTIYQLYSLFASETEREAMAEAYRKGGCGYGDFKKQLFEAYWNYFAPMREKRAELLQNQDYVNQVLREGAEKARVVAVETLKRTRTAMGL
ncbi:MAG: tryptophan--tRNA ligase, partial [Verrucomicrobiota bacterium]